MADIESFERNTDGKLPAFAWPGGYTLVYMTHDGCDLCADCATKELDDPDGVDPVISGDIYWEGPDMTCDECSRVIESSYGDPDEDA
jgi:hypothetical protein